MTLISSYLTLFLSIIMIIFVSTSKSKFITIKEKVNLSLIFSLMTIYSTIGLFWIFISETTWIYDYAEIIYLAYNILIFKKFYNIIKKGRVK